MFSQIKDMECIERDFHSAALVMPRGLGVKYFFFSEHGHVAYHIEEDDE